MTDPGRRSIGVVAVVAAATLAVRVAVAPADALGSLAAFAIDLAVLGGLCLMATSPRNPTLRGPALLLGTGALVGYGSLVFWQAWFLDLSREFQFSALGLTPGAVLFFVREIVPPGGWLAFGAFWALALVGRRWELPDRLLGRLALLESGPRRGLAGAALLLGGVAAGRAATVPHPLSTSIRELLANRYATLIAAADSVLPTDHLDRRITIGGPVASRFRRALVFVMEGVSLDEFEARRAELPADGFVRQVDSFATKYHGYYTANQESRTARMAMLHARLIPYEAYRADWWESFGFLSAQGGLVGAFNAAGWRTALAIPLAELPWDLRALPWGLRIGLDRTDPAKDGFTCLAPTQFDRGCEDRIVLGQVGRLLDETGPTFLFQHFLFGHTSQWETTTGMNRVHYYDRYLASVLDSLRARNALAETLIVLTADHGPRSDAAVSNPAAYQVPLWLINPAFPREDRVGFFGNPEFAEVLLETLRDGAPAPVRERPFLMAMGPTTRTAFSCTRPSGEFGFFRIVAERHVRVVRARPDSAEAWRPCVSTFFRYRSTFAAEAAAASQR